MCLDELHGHGAFADCRGAAFGRAGADVTGREHTGDTGLKQGVRIRCCAGQDETVAVAGVGCGTGASKSIPLVRKFWIGPVRGFASATMARVSRSRP